MNGRQTRTLQRAAHLATGLLVIAYVYLTPTPGSLVEAAIRWAVLPLLVLTGVAMWQWPRARRALRRRSERETMRV